MNLILPVGQWYCLRIIGIGDSEGQCLIIRFQYRPLEFYQSWASCCSGEGAYGAYLYSLNWHHLWLWPMQPQRRLPSVEARAKFLLWETRTQMLSCQFPSKLHSGKWALTWLAFLRGVQPGTNLEGATRRVQEAGRGKHLLPSMPRERQEFSMKSINIWVWQFQIPFIAHPYTT